MIATFWLRRVKWTKRQRRLLATSLSLICGMHVFYSRSFLVSVSTALFWCLPVFSFVNSPSMHGVHLFGKIGKGGYVSRFEGRQGNLWYLSCRKHFVLSQQLVVWLIDCQCNYGFSSFLVSPDEVQIAKLGFLSGNVARNLFCLGVASVSVTFWWFFEVIW